MSGMILKLLTKTTSSKTKFAIYRSAHSAGSWLRSTCWQAWMCTPLQNAVGAVKGKWWNDISFYSIASRIPPGQGSKQEWQVAERWLILNGCGTKALGITLQGPPCRDHLAGTTLQGSPCRDRLAGITLQGSPCRDYLAGTTLQEPPCRNHVAGITLLAGHQVPQITRMQKRTTLWCGLSPSAPSRRPGSGDVSVQLNCTP